MTIRPILITGNSVLHTKAAPVTDFGPELEQLIADMFETMAAAPGVGLAAPQIGVSLQVFVYDWSEGENHWRGVAVNPKLSISELEQREPDEDHEVEGCLSVPGERMPLMRANRAMLQAQDATGASFEIEAEGWLARIFQHEYDHLQGTLYYERLEPQHREEIDFVIADEGWGVEGKSWLPGVDEIEA